MIEQELRSLIARGETLTVEFKSDRGPLPDAELLDTVVCLANRQGGVLLLGIEDDGRVTGTHPKHQSGPGALAAFVASRTVPPLSVEVVHTDLPEGQVTLLTVPAARQPISTSDGRLLIRYLDLHNRPGCRPLYAYELTDWMAERGQADPSARIIPDATWDDLDPLEFARLRRMVAQNSGDSALLTLSDQEIASALGLTRSTRERLMPTLAGLLLMGKEQALREYVPAHEVAFQVLHGTDVRVNEFRRWPLLRIHEWLTEAIALRNEEQELMVGGVRIGIPRYDSLGTREAINNALIHRDYARLGAVHVQLHDDYLRVSNPGGFVEGVQTNNLLTTEPRPRNPRLADAFKRVGLVERIGRGVETIYRSQLRSGRRLPDYTLSTAVSVNVVLDTGPAALDFVKAIVSEEGRQRRTFTVNELLVLAHVWRDQAIDVSTALSLLQRDESQTRAILDSLVAASLLTARDAERSRAYMLAASLARSAGRLTVEK